MNTLVIFTGGTIASSLNDGYLSPSVKGSKEIIELYKKSFPKEARDVDFSTLSPFTILSENLDGDYLNQIIDTVKQIDISKYDGIILAHGTDTLQYTAAALSLVFSDIKIPLIMVSSNYILSDARANGLDNFRAAVNYIKCKERVGVYVAYCNEKSENSQCIFPAGALLPHQPYSDALSSINESIENATYELIISSNELFDFKSVKLSKNSNVLYLQATPGMSYPLEALHMYKAVLISTYHSGTLNTSSTDLGLFCEAAQKLDIPVYIVGTTSQLAYESTKVFEDLGIKKLPEISPILAYMYLWFTFCFA